MKIKVLICTPEGGQAIEEKEVPDTWFPSELPEDGDIMPVS